MRLIDADALMQSLGITNMDCDKCAWYDKEWSCCKRGGDFESACFAIENAPTIEERKKGKWIKDRERFGDNAYHCSQCGAVLEKDNLEWRNNYYCYHCGADNRGDA